MAILFQPTSDIGTSSNVGGEVPPMQRLNHLVVAVLGVKVPM